MDTRQVLSVLSVVKGVQSVIRADLESLKQSNQDLWREAIVARENSQTQEHMLKQITKFLEHQYEPRRWGGIPEAVPRDINNRSSSPVPSTPRKRPRLLLGDSCDSVGHAGSASSGLYHYGHQLLVAHRIYQKGSRPWTLQAIDCTSKYRRRHCLYLQRLEPLDLPFRRRNRAALYTTSRHRLPLMPRHPCNNFCQILSSIMPS